MITEYAQQKLKDEITDTWEMWPSSDPELYLQIVCDTLNECFAHKDIKLVIENTIAQGLPKTSLREPI